MKRKAESKEQKKREKAQADKEVADMYKRRPQVYYIGEWAHLQICMVVCAMMGCMHMIVCIYF